MAFCPNCGNTIPEGSEFCGSCGSRFEGNAAPNATENKVIGGVVRV